MVRVVQSRMAHSVSSEVMVERGAQVLGALHECETAVDFGHLEVEVGAVLGLYWV